MTAAHELGRRGEDAAAAHYERLGFALERNWRGQRGELDLICVQGELAVFCEVKTRSSDRFGRGAEAVDRRKQQTIRRLALQWLAQQSQSYRELRFDVVEVDARGHLQVHEGCF